MVPISRVHDYGVTQLGDTFSAVVADHTGMVFLVDDGTSGGDGTIFVEVRFTSRAGKIWWDGLLQFGPRHTFMVFSW